MNFQKVKQLFKDEINTSLYVPLFEKIEIDLMYAIYEKEKIIVVSGDSGNGKTFLLKKLYENLKQKSDDFELCFIVNPLDETRKINEFLLDSNHHRVLFIDEAQTLTDEKIERLRILADNRNYTIILATHNRDENKIFEKKHFRSRINYFVHLKAISLDKTELFINSKLIQNGEYDVVSWFTDANYRLIYNLTKGNLRMINQLLYKTFDIISYFSDRYPYKVSKKYLENKYIEMANMDLKEIDA